MADHRRLARPKSTRKKSGEQFDGTDGKERHVNLLEALREQKLVRVCVHAEMIEDSLVVLDVVNLTPEPAIHVESAHRMNVACVVEDILPPQVVVLLPDELVEVTEEGRRKLARTKLMPTYSQSRRSGGSFLPYSVMWPSSRWKK